MDEEGKFGVFTVRGQNLTTVSIGESKWCLFVEICSKLLPDFNKASIQQRVNRSKARMVLADKASVATLKRQELITKQTGKVYLISVENIAHVLSLFEENGSRDSLPSQDSALDDEDGGNQGDECGDKLDDDDECELGAEEVLAESGLPESVNDADADGDDGEGDGDGDENSEEEGHIDGKVGETGQEPSAASIAATAGPGRGRGRRRCRSCSALMKPNTVACTECGKRIGRKRRGGFPGAYARRMKRKRLEAKEQPVEEYEDDKPVIPNERPRRWGKRCAKCNASCSITAMTCSRCGSSNLQDTSTLEQAAAPQVVEEEQDVEDGDDGNDAGEEPMDAGNGEDGEMEEGSKAKAGSRSKWCRHCSLYMPENSTECSECGRPVKRKYRRRGGNISSRPQTAKRRAALVARATTIGGTPRHRADVDGGQPGDNGDGDQGGGQGGKWCSRCQKTAPPLVTHCLTCGKELKRVYRKRSAIWQQNQQQQVQQQQERLQERRRAGIKGLASVVGGCEITGSDGQHLNWTQRFNLTSFIPDEEHAAMIGDSARPTVVSDSVEVHGGRAVVRRPELKRHENFMPRNAIEAVGFAREKPVLRRPIVDLPPEPTQGTDREKLHYAQCFLNIKMGLSQSELVNVVTEARHRHHNTIESSARSFDDVDAEYQATKARTAHLQCQGKSLEKRLADLKQRLSTSRKDLGRLNRLARQTERQERQYSRVAQHFQKRLVACQGLLADSSTTSSQPSSTSSVNISLPRRTLADSVTSERSLSTCSQSDLGSTVGSVSSVLSPSAANGSHAAAAVTTVTALAQPRPSSISSTITTLTEPVKHTVVGVTAETWAQLQSKQKQLSHDHTSASCDSLQPSVGMVS